MPYKNKKKDLKKIKILESRVELVKIKIETNQNWTLRMKRDINELKINNLKQKKVELSRKPGTLKYSKDEIQTRLGIENQKLSNILQKIGILEDTVK